MDDLSICKRIAEIEGFKARINAPYRDDFKHVIAEGYAKTKDKMGYWDDVYNPLTNDALCFQLMVKYRIKFSWLWSANDGTDHYEAYINNGGSWCKFDKSPNKAICLAIIEAHKDK